MSHIVVQTILFSVQDNICQIIFLKYNMCALNIISTT